jgi:hypothetical protein
MLNKCRQACAAQGPCNLRFSACAIVSAMLAFEGARKRQQGKQQPNNLDLSVATWPGAWPSCESVCVRGVIPLSTLADYRCHNKCQGVEVCCCW